MKKNEYLKLLRSGVRPQEIAKKEGVSLNALYNRFLRARINSSQELVKSVKDKDFYAIKGTDYLVGNLGTVVHFERRVPVRLRLSRHTLVVGMEINGVSVNRSLLKILTRVFGDEKAKKLVDKIKNKMIHAV